MEQKKPTFRMCIACRTMQDKTQLVRIAKNKSGEICIDLDGRAQGRGAFVCKSKECLEKCKKQRAINKAFKGQVPAALYDSLLLLLLE